MKCRRHPASGFQIASLFYTLQGEPKDGTFLRRDPSNKGVGGQNGTFFPHDPCPLQTVTSCGFWLFRAEKGCPFSRRPFPLNDKVTCFGTPCFCPATQEKVSFRGLSKPLELKNPIPYALASPHKPTLRKVFLRVSARQNFLIPKTRIKYFADPGFWRAISYQKPLPDMYN